MRLLIVDDHPVVLEGLAYVFRAEGHDVVMATCIADAIDAVRTCGNIDLMVIDLTINEDADGLALVKKLRKFGIAAPAIVYTMHEELWNLALLLDSDVEGIVLKGESIDELMEAVKAVRCGLRYRSPVLSERINAMKSCDGGLSSKELNIINLIGKGESTAEIADRLCLSHKAVEYHRSNILKKLESKTMTEAIKNAVKLGIITCVAILPAVHSKAQPTGIPEAVDLGLSVRWADRNLGAASPLESGSYFAFGEIEEKDCYHWDTYTLCDGGDMFSQFDLGQSSICATEYDVARHCLGDGWRLPTVDEVEELISICTAITFQASGDQPAYVHLTAPNGAGIDFPLAGYMNSCKLVYAGMESVVHTGSFYVEEGEEDGFSYRLNSPFNLAFVAGSDPLIIEGSSHLGLPVRPVRDISDSVDSIVASSSCVSAVYSIDGRYMGASADALPSGIYIMRSADGIAVRCVR